MLYELKWDDGTVSKNVAEKKIRKNMQPGSTVEVNEEFAAY